MAGGMFPNKECQLQLQYKTRLQGAFGWELKDLQLIRSLVDFKQLLVNVYL